MADEIQPKPTVKKRGARNKPTDPSPGPEAPTAETATESDPPEPGTTRREVFSARSEVESASAGGETLDAALDALQSIADRNRERFGQLVVHYPERDVTITLDGASAARVMAVHAGVGSRLRYQDPLIPGLADMENLWASIDLDQALAMSWFPMLPTGAGRKMTIDPAVPEELSI